MFHDYLAVNVSSEWLRHGYQMGFPIRCVWISLKCPEFVSWWYDLDVGDCIHRLNHTVHSVQAAGEELFYVSTHAHLELSDLREFIEDRMNEWSIPGLAIGVVRNREVIFTEGFGNRDFITGTTVDSQSLFPIGSCTKAFTTTAISMLVDEGILNWDTPVKNYLPEFAMNDPVATGQLTLRDIACHRSGLPRHDLSWYAPAENRAERVHRIRYLQPSQPFRSKFQYNNLMYMTAGHVMEQVTGQSWEEFVRLRIFEPLEMTSSNFSVHTTKESVNHAQPYVKTGLHVHCTDFLDVSAIGPAGSINSNIDDMTNWVSFHLNNGQHGDRRIVSTQGLSETHSPHMVLPIPPGKNKEIPIQAYALGWGVYSYRGYPLVSHQGGVDGFSSEMSFIPGEDMGLVILTNLEEAQPVLSTMSRYIFDRMLGLPEIDWNARHKGHLERKRENEHSNVISHEIANATATAHPLCSYVGRYHHPGYGDIAVSIQGAFLCITYYKFKYQAHYFREEIFEIEREAVSGGDASTIGKFATFYIGSSGYVHSVSIRMEPDLNVGEIVFSRVLD